MKYGPPIRVVNIKTVRRIQKSGYIFYFPTLFLAT